MIKKRLICFAITLVTLVANYWVFYGIAYLLGAKSPHFIAGALTSAMFIHELFHFLFFEINGIPSLMIFLVVIGGVSPIPGFGPKFSKLSWERQSMIILAGVLGNFVMMVIAYFLEAKGFISHIEFLKLLNLNGVLVMWNLFAFGKFDGGLFTKILFDSISENRDTKYEMGLTAAFLLIIIGLLIITGKYSLFNIALFFWGIHWQANHDDPYGSRNKKAIPVSHQKWWAIVYLIMIAAGAVITILTPTWLFNKSY